MDVEENILEADHAGLEPRVSRRQLAQQAVALAMQSRWDEAVDMNQQIVDMGHADAETYNRLGNACTKLGRIDEAREAYARALQADPANLIAQRNLERLNQISETEAEELRRRAGTKLDPQFFMEETGKAAVVTLESVTRLDVLLTLTAGDEVLLQPQGNYLMVTTDKGERIGMVEERLASRLVRLMETGNQYRAGIVGVDGTVVRVMLRETEQSPQNAGRISFPPRVETLPRPYLREGLLRRSGDEEDEDEVEVNLEDETVDEDEEDAGDFGFSEGTLDES